MNNLKQYASLLNDAAPKGEFLAYINEDEAEMLKDNGALGLLTPQGIPSFFTAGLGQGDSISPGTSSTGGTTGGGYGRKEGETAAQDMGNYNYDESEGTTVNQFEINNPEKLAKEQELAAKEKAKKEKEQDDARLDYLTTEYLDVELNPEQKKEFEKYRTGVSESITPSTKTSNKIIGGLLSSFLFPFAGTAYNAYLDATAMGYKIKNPFANIFNSSGGEISVEDINNLKDKGDGSNAKSQFIQNIAKIINPNLPDSQVNNYFKNIGSNSLGVSPAYMTTYNQAKDQVSKSLNLTPNTQQFGYGNTFNDNYSMSMTSANPFFDELTNQGLI
tara:strand:- start:897 stop:1889 length:993 start_codon:yes stop_codon:yes gene_type:complete